MILFEVQMCFSFPPKLAHNEALVVSAGNCKISWMSLFSYMPQALIDIQGNKMFTETILGKL